MEGQGTELHRHLAAVMFTDMVGYSALMRRDEAAALRNRARHREALEGAASEWAGQVLQYFGDGSLSLFASSLQAVRAALRIQRTLGGDPLVRIGLHLGDVAYDEQGAYGDAINVAARLEALAEPGGVLISREVYTQIRSQPDLRVEHVADVRLKNIRGPVATYAVVTDGPAPTTEVEPHVPAPVTEAESDVPGPAEARLPRAVQVRLDERAKPVREWLGTGGGAPRRIPLVGREREMESIHRLVEMAEAGHGGTLFVRGARGVGKTRVAEEAQGYAQERGWAVLAGRAYAAERRAPFAPFVDALHPVLRGLDGGTLAALAPGGEDAIAALFPTLEVETDAGDPVHLEPGEFRARLFWHFTEMLGRMARYRPVLLILEDLDFADRSSLELLRFVARRCMGFPILMMCQYTGMDHERRKALRSTERQLRSQNAASALELEPFDEAETGLFVARTLDVEPEALSQLSAELFRWTEGIPFFLEGTLRGLVKAGSLKVGDPAVSADALRALDLPESVRDAVLVWTSRLSEDAFALGELLAVAGTHMNHEQLQHVCGLPETSLGEALEELTRDQILSEQEAHWTLVYDFRHPLIRETLRTELPAARRRALHGQIAECLEDYYGDSAGEHAVDLAYHFSHAPPGPMRRRAVTYLAEAGARALAQYANREAAAHFGEALEWFAAVSGPDRPRRGASEDGAMRQRLVMGLAAAKRRLGKIEESVTLLESLLPIADEAGDRQTMAVVHRAVGLALMRGGELERALEAFERGAAAARESGTVPLVARIQLARGVCYHASGRPEEALQVLEEALSLAVEFEEPTLLARAHSALVQLHLFRGDLARGREHAETALRLARETGADGVAFWSQWAMAAMEGLIGNTAEMARRVAEARRLADDLGSPFLRLATAELNIELAYALGDWDEGVREGERAADLARSVGQRTVLPRLLAWLSLMYIGRGELEKAKAVTDEAWLVGGADRALERVGTTHVHTVVPAHIGRAAYHMARQDWDEAVRVAEAGLSVADRSGYVVWAIHHLLPIIAEASIHARHLEKAMETGRRMRAEAEAVGHPLGLAWADACDAILTWLQGDAAQGAKALRVGVESLASIPLTFEAAKLRRHLAGRLLDIGDLAAAREELAQATEVFQRLGAKPELEAALAQREEMR